MRIVVAIIDTVTQDVVGPLMIHRHEAPAIRMFEDVAKMDGSAVHQHVEDHELWQLGFLNDTDLTLQASKKLLISGAQWLALQTNKQEEH